jgi:hypothetical protein
MVIERRMVGKKPRGRPRIGITDDFKAFKVLLGNEEEYWDREIWTSWMPRTYRKAEN